LWAIFDNAIQSLDDNTHSFDDSTHPFNQEPYLFDDGIGVVRRGIEADTLSVPSLNRLYGSPTRFAVMKKYKFKQKCQLKYT